MTDATYLGRFAPDNPVQRLPWILAISMLLVLLALLGLGRILHAPARHLVKPKPLQARIYELPASRGSMAVKPAHGGRHSAARQAQRHGQLHHSLMTHTQKEANVSIPRVTRSTAAALSQTSHTRQSIQRPVNPSKPPSINWATQQSQIDAAIRQSEASPQQIHDPHTLEARYYLASLLEKLQRVGDMNMPTNLTGMPVIKLVIGTHGELEQLTLLRTSGNDKLDQDALQIARESAPFAAFPDKLKRQTRHFELVCHMNFVGYGQIYAGY